MRFLSIAKEFLKFPQRGKASLQALIKNISSKSKEFLLKVLRSDRIFARTPDQWHRLLRPDVVENPDQWHTYAADGTFRRMSPDETVYRFQLDPDEWRPHGSVNFSRIDAQVLHSLSVSIFPDSRGEIDFANLHQSRISTRLTGGKAISLVKYVYTPRQGVKSENPDGSIQVARELSNFDIFDRMQLL